MQQPEKRKYTYDDYAKWDDGNRYELIDGDVYLMSPAPSRVHQRISGNLYLQLATYLKGKTCEVYAAPFDVRLNADAGDDTVVQPDLAVFCDPGKLDDRGAKGAPDLVVEILSPSSVRHDQLVKFNKYRAVGVREYWIVNPEARNVLVFQLAEGNYISRSYGEADTVPVSVLDDCRITLADVFPEAPPEAPGAGPELAGE